MATLTGPIPSDSSEYDRYIEEMRKIEYPMLADSIYLDHAGTTLYSKTQMERFHQDMMANLYGNPHSASPSSQRSTLEVEDIRLQLLRFFNADPEYFDLVFTANATAAIKLVADGFRETEGGFEYVYHVDAHTSLVGVRDLAGQSRCLESDEAVDQWMDSLRKRDSGQSSTTLFAYPAQSNMNGRRLPSTWCQQVKPAVSKGKIYTLLDAAAYASTSPLDLADVDAAADYTALSLYKIFGFPDLGALIVKKSSAHIFERRKFFGGGTVDMVVCRGEQWHARKSGSLHERLEDGTLPIHSIVALKSAMRTYNELFVTLERVSRHTSMLAKQLYDDLSTLKHINGARLCQVYKDPKSTYGDTLSQGPVIAFNMLDNKGHWVSGSEVEKLASIRNIHLRTGGVCNPGGVATALNLAPWEMRENFSTGHRCGGEDDILNGKPTGVIRVSLGAMSTRSDVEGFLRFLDDFFVCKAQIDEPVNKAFLEPSRHKLYVESITVYPIKSCGGYQVASGQIWDVRQEGLAWDREWCVVHQGTSKALSQKQHPRMALIRPILDLKNGVLNIRMIGRPDAVSVPLCRNPALFNQSTRESDARVCGEVVKMFTYRSSEVAEFFTTAVGVPCTLARFNAASSSIRHSKPHLARNKAPQQAPGFPRPLTLNNESPILTISRSSLNYLNEQIKVSGGKAARPSVFRANLVLAEDVLLPPGQEQPWVEDEWQSIQIGGEYGPILDVLGGCRRCQMVCVDQQSAEKNAEPFSTLAKTRRFGGRVLFGVHTALKEGGGGTRAISVGDQVDTFMDEDT